MISYDDILKQFEQESHSANSAHDIQLLKSRFLGKKSDLAKALAGINQLEPSLRAKTGKELNILKNTLEEKINYLNSALALKENLSPIDVTRPGLPLYSNVKKGHMHPSSQVLRESFRVFSELGFAIVDSPEIESDWFNFEALNMPESHPAREMQDTFYIKHSDYKLLPRTHTSGMQVRFMKENKPPFKIIVPGKVFRSENEDATHSWSFNQIEGLVVGEGVSMADLKGTLLQIVKKQLGEDTQIRFRASYFPYTEPSVEVDAKYNGKWLELGGAGMVHPEVLKNGGIDPEKYSGFAFGWGVERIAAIKYGITDLRLLWRPNLDYLEQF
jgi:phenylalanyl-tRNA synthetase alpha chain